MNPVINFLNWLTDMDWGWWPLLKYRPQKNERIDSTVILKVTPLFGTVVGCLILLILNELNSATFVLGIYAISWLLFFIIYRITFAVAWNIRVKYLNQNNDEK